MNTKTVDFIKYTRDHSAELADYLEQVCHAKFSFSGEYPIQHSAHNHLHLWKLEYEAENNDWIDLDYKVGFVKTIMQFWRENLRQYEPYHTTGYMLYLYEDTAPTISVTAKTKYGFPYHSLQLVDDIKKVLARYENLDWSDNFSFDFDSIYYEKKIIKVIEKYHGSIGKPSANALNIKVGELRKLIINLGLDWEVNDIRKKNKKRAADFSNELKPDHYTGLAWQGEVPPKY